MCSIVTSGFAMGPLGANLYHFDHLSTTDSLPWEVVNDDLQFIPDDDADLFGFADRRECIGRHVIDRLSHIFSIRRFP